MIDISLPCKMGFSHKKCQACKAPASLLLGCQLKQRSHLGWKNLCQNKCRQCKALPTFLGVFNGHTFPNLGHEPMYNTRETAFTWKKNETTIWQTYCHSEGMGEKMPSPPVTSEVTHWLSNLAKSQLLHNQRGWWMIFTAQATPLVSEERVILQGHLDQDGGSCLLLFWSFT